MPAEVEHVRLLGCDFEVRTNSPALADQIAHVAPRAEQDVPLVERSSVTITWTGEEYRIAGDGIDDFELSAVSALETLYQYLYARALAALPDHIPISAASGTRNGRNFVVAGTEGAGKTTLALGLMLEGVDIAGDALALLCRGEALAFPRRFLAREDGVGQVAGLRKIARFAACIGNPHAGRLVAIDPLEFGKPWRITPLPVSTIFHIDANHGARSTLRRCGKLEMMQRLLPRCAPPLSRRRDWLADLSSTVDRAETFVIELGELDAAVRAVVAALG